MKINAEAVLEDASHDHGDFLHLEAQFTAFEDIPRLGDLAPVNVQGVLQSCESQGDLLKFNIISEKKRFLQVQAWRLAEAADVGDQVEIVGGEIDLVWRRIGIAVMSALKIVARNQAVPADTVDLEWPTFQRHQRASDVKGSPKGTKRMQ